MLKSLPFLLLLGLMGCAHLDSLDEQEPTVVKKSCTSCAYNRAVNAALEHFHLGQLQRFPTQLSGGFTNRVYCVETTTGKYAVKVMQKNGLRTRSKSTLAQIEILKKSQAVPVVMAKKSADSSVFETSDFYVMVFDFIQGKNLAGSIGPVNKEQAYAAGQYLAKIHTQKAPKTLAPFEYNYSVDLASSHRLRKKYHNQEDFWAFAEKTQAAYQRLRHNQVYGHGDFQPHNIMIEPSGRLQIIDWELAGLINPETEFMAALITFSGLATDHFDPSAFSAFIKGYKKSGGHFNDNTDDAILSAIHKLWVNWIVYNMEQDNAPVIKKTMNSLLLIKEKIPSLKKNFHTQISIKYL